MQTNILSFFEWYVKHSNSIQNCTSTTTSTTTTIIIIIIIILCWLCLRVCAREKAGSKCERIKLLSCQSKAMPAHTTENSNKCTEICVSIASIRKSTRILCAIRLFSTESVNANCAPNQNYIWIKNWWIRICCFLHGTFDLYRIYGIYIQSQALYTQRLWPSQPQRVAKRFNKMPSVYL